MPQPDYDIFEDVVDTYETLKYENGSNHENDATSSFCNSIDINDEYKKQVVDVCKKFVYIFKMLELQYKQEGKAPSTKKYHEFINFWLQLNLLRRNIPDTYNSVLLDHLKRNYEAFDAKNTLKDKLLIIEPISFKSMRMLYNLYKNYYGSLHKNEYEYENEYEKEYENKNENEYSCTNFFKKFKVNYDKCLRRCYSEGDSKLCDVMKNFRKIYNPKKFPGILSKCSTTSCPSLPELSEYHSITTTNSEDSNIGYKLVQTSTFFNPFELPQLKGVNYKELNHLIWLQYNMPFQYDKEMKKIYMMNILQQFLQYCYENKKNEKLSSFMKEFIIQYYNKSKEVYDDIFRECKTMSEEKTYCQLYEACKTKFNKDFSTIVTDTNEYIKQQENYIKSLSALELWIFKAQSMFQDFGAMSRISPTIMSTLVAIVVSLFFLYKLTPLSSILRKEKKKRKIPLFYPQRIIQDVKVDNSGNVNPKTKRGKIRFAYQPS